MVRSFLGVLLLLPFASLAFTTTTHASKKRPARRTVTMVDQNFVTGAVVSAAGFTSGILMSFFAERQITRSEARGSEVMSEVTKAKMSAMFMEDEVRIFLSFLTLP